MKRTALLLIVVIALVSCGPPEDAAEEAPDVGPDGGPVGTDVGDGTPDMDGTTAPDGTTGPDSTLPGEGRGADGDTDSVYEPVPDLPTGSPTIAWRTSVGRGVSRAPVAHNGSILVFGDDRTVGYYRVTDGRRERSVDLGRYVDGEVAVVGRVFCFPEGPNTLHGFSPADGNRLWTTDLGAPVVAGPIGGEQIFVVATASAVYALEAQTGRETWSRDAGAAVTALVWSEEGVIVATEDGRLRLLDDATSDEVWITVPTGGIPRHLVIAGEAVVVFGRRGGIGLVSLADGAYSAVDPVMGVDTNGSAPTTNDEAPDSDGAAPDADEGATIGAAVGRPARDPRTGDVFFVDESGVAVAMTFPDGEVAWTYDLGGRSTVPVAVARSMVVIVEDGGDLVALDRRTGSPLWRVEGKWWTPGGALLDSEGIFVAARHGVLTRLVPGQVAQAEPMRFVPRSQPYEGVPVAGEHYLSLPEAGVYRIELPNQERAPVELRLYYNGRQVASNAGKVGLDAGFRVEVPAARELRMEVEGEDAAGFVLVVTRVDG